MKFKKGLKENDDTLIANCLNKMRVGLMYGPV